PGNMPGRILCQLSWDGQINNCPIAEGAYLMACKYFITLTGLPGDDPFEDDLLVAELAIEWVALYCAVF
ncbi:MAG: hypothetical protein KDD99_33290, partial [Bacteroidetes bacterium]|nr:hypothetical protein [Bacteroidota bacterium]